MPNSDRTTKKLMMTFDISHPMTSDPIARGHIAVDGIHCVVIEDSDFYEKIAKSNPATIVITAAEWKDNTLPKVNHAELSTLVNTIVETAKRQYHYYHRTSGKQRMLTDEEMKEVQTRKYHAEGKRTFRPRPKGDK